MGNLTGWHLLIVLAIVVLIFGAAKLPALAKSVGQSARIFKSEMKTMKDEPATTTDPSDSADASHAVSVDTTPKV